MVEIHPCVVSEGSHKQGGAWKDKERVKPGRKVLRRVEAIRMARLCRIWASSRGHGKRHGSFCKEMERGRGWIQPVDKHRLRGSVTAVMRCGERKGGELGTLPPREALCCRGSLGRSHAEEGRPDGACYAGPEAPAGTL